jgi:pimeloyl-ACP methyl ester carboxylesterase
VTAAARGRQAGKEFLARLKERTDDRDTAISVRAFRAQLKAIHRWGRQPPAELASIRQPVLVLNGESDKMVPTKNTVDLDRRLLNSQHVVYPDAGHVGTELTIVQHRRPLATAEAETARPPPSARPALTLGLRGDVLR